MGIENIILKLVDAINNAAQAGTSLASAIDRLSDSKLDDLTGVKSAPIAKLEEVLEVEDEPTTEAPVKKDYSFDEVRDVVIYATQTKGREAMVEILDSFGVSNIKDLEPSQYAELVAKCEA